MKVQTYSSRYTSAAVAWIAVLGGGDKLLAQQPGQSDTGVPGTSVVVDDGPSSVEQGQTSLTDSFEEWREWRIEKRRKALEATKFDVNIRSFYFDREKFDDTESEAWTLGGWAGFKTGYFFDHLAIGATAYTSQPLYAPDEKDGTLLLQEGQDGYTVLGEAYADILIAEDLNLFAGRKGFDTPFINRNDTRMTPNTFEAIVLQGKAKFEEGDCDSTLKYGLGYFDQIKERNSDDFVSMSQDAGATVDRGVFTAGSRYEKGNFSIGAIEYYCPDTINIGYGEATLKVPINDEWKPKISAQFADQRSVGDEALTGDSFSAQQFGFKAELPVGNALFTGGYTQTTDGDNMQSPWSGYPGYTSVQVQDFNRSGEGAFLLRAGYEFPQVKGLSTYALAVFGTEPDDETQFRQDEYDLNLQWVPPEGSLKGLALRLRYALVQQEGGDVSDLTDLRLICNYAIQF